MNTPKPDQTINQLFEEFLADQEARLSPKTFDKYEGIIHLYRSYLESYWPGHSGKGYEAITQAKHEGMGQPWTLSLAGQVFFTMPRSAVVRGFVLNHLIHHRAHLCVYLRLNDVPVPGMYGPSGDE